MDVFWNLPPVSRTITALAVVVSALGHTGMIDLMYYVFIRQYVFTITMIPQLWRIATAFLITKPKFGILMDPYFLYQYGSGLELESSRFSQPGDFFVYTCFLATVITVSASLFLCLHTAFTLAEAVPGIEGDYPCVIRSPVIRKTNKGLRGIVLQRYIFLQALSLAFAYTYAQDNPTRQVSFFIITFDARYLPFALLFLTFIMDGGDAALTQATGLIAAHLYDFLTRIWPTFGGGRNFIFTPRIVKQWFGAKPGAAQQRGYGTAYQGRTPADDRPTARTTGAAPAWGPGRRLGD
ncbi:Der1-like protein [Polyplosphaeria fusca]|uniref:Derlin n=1 Tax=Polyplosphaeria fusca TaxID=682080 RepID=A0A9P4R8U2_9PLEO|nr:Der1-like protein [Polyplosphaeria fusca]